MRLIGRAPAIGVEGGECEDCPRRLRLPRRPRGRRAWRTATARQRLPEASGRSIGAAPAAAVRDGASADGPRPRVEPATRQRLQEDLTALARGDRAAFDPAFRLLWPLLRGFAARFLSAAEAEDAAQEALLKIFARASEFDPRRDALSWALGITAWQVRTHRTRARRRREEPADADGERADAAPSPESAAIHAELAEAIDRTLGQLRPADAATLAAYARGERPDLPAATFRKRVERALARLRARWRTGHDCL